MSSKKNRQATDESGNNTDAAVRQYGESLHRKLDLNLLGKEYFTQLEAAHYCCMSLSQFQKIAPSENIWPASFGGKLIYRRTDLQRAMEYKWQRLEDLVGVGSAARRKK